MAATAVSPSISISTSAPPSDEWHVPLLPSGDVDWDTLVQQKSGPWEQLTFNTTKRIMDEVQASWRQIKKDGLLEEFGRLTKQHLFKQNPSYEQLYATPEQFPFIQIIDAIATQTHKALGRQQREVVAELMLVGNVHKAKLGLSLKDYKAMTAGVVYSMATMHSSLTAPQRRREVLAWQSLLAEMSAIMHRGEGLPEAERMAVARAAHGEPQGMRRSGSREGFMLFGKAGKDGCAVM